MSDIKALADGFKKELTSGNDAALGQMVHTYGKTWQRLEGQFLDISKAIDAERQAGRSPKPAWLSQQARYKSLMAQCEAEVTSLAKSAHTLTREQQRLAAELGLKHSERLVKESLGPTPDASLKVSWNRIPKEAVTNMVGTLGDGSPLAYKFAGMPTDTVQSIKDALATGLAAGVGPRAMVGLVKDAYAGGLSNALVVCRTESMRAYRSASGDNYKANEDVLEGWYWSAGHSSRTCAACWGMDGSFHSIDEEMCDHPCGRCSAIPLTKTWKQLFPDADIAEGKDTRVQPWSNEEVFAKLSEGQQRHVLGKTLFEHYQNGDIKLADIPTLVESKVWGNHYRVGKIADVLERAKGTQGPKVKTGSIKAGDSTLVVYKVKGQDIYAVSRVTDTGLVLIHPGATPSEVEGIIKFSEALAKTKANKAGKVSIVNPKKVLRGEKLEGLLGDGRSSEVKARISEELALRLSGSADFDAWTIDEAINMGALNRPNAWKALDDAVKHNMRTQAVSNLLHSWANTSGDSNPLAVALQTAAKNELKLTGATLEHLLDQADLANEVDRLTDAYGAGFRAFVRAQYDHTQAWLEAEGIDEVVVFRGFGLLEDDLTESLLYMMSTPTIDAVPETLIMQPLSSFSASAHTAVTFAEGAEYEAKYPFVVKSVVPRERVFSTCQTGFGCRSETEVVVLGKEPLPGEVWYSEGERWGMVESSKPWEKWVSE